MKKLLVLLVLLLFIIIFSMYGIKLNNEININTLKRYNSEFDIFLNKTITGTDIATLINKAINENEKNKIEKDEKKYYIENDLNSIKIEIKLTATDKTYPMEEIYNNNTSEFIKFFSTEEFRCTSIEYHEKTGKIKSILFEQI